MEFTIVRRNGALSVCPASPYLTGYLAYYHRAFKTVNYKRVNDFQYRLLHQVTSDGCILTLPGFFEQICKLIEENNDTYVIKDERSPLPPIDWEAIQGLNWQGIGATGLRDYQIKPISEFLVKAQVNNGIVLATGG